VGAVVGAFGTAKVVTGPPPDPGTVGGTVVVGALVVVGWAVVLAPAVVGGAVVGGGGGRVVVGQGTSWPFQTHEGAPTPPWASKSSCSRLGEIMYCTGGIRLGFGTGNEEYATSRSA
jgi:hypothetical protein